MGNIISGALILTSIGMFFVYINPLYSGITGAQSFKDKSIKELRADEEQYKNALTKTKEISEIQSGLIAKFNSIPRGDRESLVKLLPDHVDTVRLIIDIDRIISKHNMTLENITVASIGESSSSKSAEVFAPGGENGVPTATVRQNTSIGPRNMHAEPVSLTFSVSGPYEVFLTFIRDLENSLRIIDIESVNFSSTGDTEGETKYTFAVNTYYLK